MLCYTNCIPVLHSFVSRMDKLSADKASAYRDALNDIDTILTTKEIVEKLSKSELGHKNLRLLVWLQDFKYMLSRLQEIRSQSENELFTRCEHNWESDQVEYGLDGNLKKIEYCSDCLCMSDYTSTR